MDWWRTNSDNLRHMNDRDIYAEMFNSLKAIPKHPFLAIPFEPRPDGDVKVNLQYTTSHSKHGTIVITYILFRIGSKQNTLEKLSRKVSLSSRGRS